jgi:hypothetical protein
MNVLNTSVSDFAEVVNLVLGLYLLRFGLIALGVLALIGLLALWVRSRRRRGRTISAAVPTAVEWIADNGLGEKAGKIVRTMWTNDVRQQMDR